MFGHGALLLTPEAYVLPQRPILILWDWFLNPPIHAILITWITNFENQSHKMKISPWDWKKFSGANIKARRLKKKDLHVIHLRYNIPYPRNHNECKRIPHIQLSHKRDDHAEFHKDPILQIFDPGLQIITLHVMIIPGGDQIRRKSLGTPPGQPKMRLSNSDAWKW